MINGRIKKQITCTKRKNTKEGRSREKNQQRAKGKRLSIDTVNINESQAAKYIKNSKVVTAYGLAKEANVKISIANAYIQKSVQDGVLKRTSGFSGHHIYQPVSK